MKRALVLVLFLLFAWPSTALAADADLGAKLHGGWNLAALAVGNQRVDLPAEMNVHMAFDRTAERWTFKTDYDGKTTEVSGSYRLIGDQLTLSLHGQSSPPMTVAFVREELHVRIALEQSPGPKTYTFIAERGVYEARPKPPPGKPLPKKPAPEQPAPSEPK